MAKKFDEVDDIILNDLDNLVTFESFYTEDGLFLDDVHKKFINDKKILEDINDKYSKKHGPTSAIMKDNRMMNLKEIITKLNWADKFHKLNTDENPNLDDCCELQAEYLKLEKKNCKNKKGNNNKEKKEKAVSRKKAKEEANADKDKDDIIEEENKNSENIPKEDSNNTQFFKNEFNLLNSFIDKREEWRNSFKNKLDSLNAQILGIEAQENLISSNNLISAEAIVGKSSENKDIQCQVQADVSNNSTVKNSKKKGAKNNKKGGKKKGKQEVELVDENANEMEIEANEANNLNLEELIPLEVFEEKLTEEEYFNMLESYEKLLIKSREEKEFIEKQKKEYNEWEKSFNKVKSMNLKTAQNLLLKAKKLIVFSTEMRNLLNNFNACLNWRKEANLILDTYKDLLHEFYFDSTDNKVKITDDKLISDYINDKAINNDEPEREELISEQEKMNLIFDSINDPLNQIKKLKEEFEDNFLIKDSSSNILNSLTSLEEKINNSLLLTKKVLNKEDNLDFLKYFAFQLQKFPQIFSDTINEINKKIKLTENFDSLINGEQSLNSIQSLKELEAKLSEHHINSDKIMLQINEKKNILLKAETNLDNLKKEYLEKGKVPDRKYLSDLHNNLRLNKLFLDNKYSLLINSWNKYYDWYENIIKLLIMLNIQNKKNKNNAFISGKNGDEEKAINQIEIQLIPELNPKAKAEVEKEYEGGITKLSEALENDIELISKLGSEQLKNMLEKIESEFNINNEDHKNNPCEELSLKGNLLNLKRNLELAVMYKKISEVTSLYNIFGMKDSNNEKLSDKMDIDDSASSAKELKTESRFSLKDIFDLYNSVDQEKYVQKDILREKFNVLKSLVSDLKKWFKAFLELYHVQYLKNNLEYFFLSKNLISKLLPTKNKSLIAKNLGALANINNEYSKIDFDQIKEMQSFFELINLISILTDYSKSVADLINFEKKINNGNKRKFDLVNADYTNLKNDFINRIEKLNFEFIAKALENELYVVENIVQNEAVKLPNNSNLNDNEILQIDENDNESINFFRNIQGEKNDNKSENVKKNLESILDKTHFSKEIENEISFYRKWIEKYNNYIGKKANKSYEQIDLCLVEILITESNKSLFDITAEVNLLRGDIEGNKIAEEVVQKLILNSENFLVKLNHTDERTLEESIANLTKFSDINVINKIKSLFWMQRAVNFISNSKARKSADSSNEKDVSASKASNNSNFNYTLDQVNIEKLNYKSALKFIQEASLLFNYQEIKRKEYYTSLMNQITAARNIRDVIDLIKTSNSNNLKQPISEDSFAKIQTEIDLCLIDLPEEIELIEKFTTEKNKLVEKFNKFIQENHTITEYDKFLFELKNFGIIMPRLIAKLERNVSDTFAITKEIKRLFDLQKANKIVLFKENVYNILDKYRSLKIETESGKGLEKMMDSSEKKIEKLKDMILNNVNLDLKLNLDLSEEYLNKQSFETETLSGNELDIFDVNSIISSIDIHDVTEEKKIKKVLWLKKYELIFEKGKYIPDFNFLKNMYSEINEISIAELNSYEKVDNLMSTLKKSQDLINKLLNTNDKDVLQKLKEDARELKIDLNEFFIQQEVKLECKGFSSKPSISANKDKNANKLSEFKTILFDNLNKNLHKTGTGNTAAKKLGFEQKDTKSDAVSMSGIIEIESNPKADKLILNKNILNLKGNNSDKNVNISNIDLNTEIEKLNNENKLLGNKRRQDDIVDLITNSHNDEFLHANENQTLSQTRSRRNINMKIDKDFYYDKEFIKNFESIKGKNMSSNKSLITEANKDLLGNKETDKNPIEFNGNQNQPIINLLDDELDKSELDQNKSSFLDKKNSDINLLNDSFIISGEVSDGEINEDVEEEIKSEKNNKNSDNTKEKSAYSYLYDSDKTEKRKNDVENIKRMINQGLKNPSLLKTGFNRVLDPLRESIRKNSLLQIQLALKENLTFYNKLGEDKIDKMADELEKHVKLNNPLVNEKYSKAVDMLVKVLKELKKYEYVSMLIVKEKLNLSKVAFYPYGPKLIEKLRKINESTSNKSKRVLNPNNPNNIVNANNKSETLNSNLKGLLYTQKDSKTNTKKIHSDKDPKKTKNDNLDFISMMNEMNEFYNSLSASDALKGKLDGGDDKNSEKLKKESQMTESLIKCNMSTSALDNSLSIPHDDLHLDDDDDSLKSECEMDAIKFSPTNKHEESTIVQDDFTNNENNATNKKLMENTDSHLDVAMNTDENAYQNLKKTSNDFKNDLNSQAINSKNPLVSSENSNSKYISPFEKLYDPFEIEEDEEEQRTNLDSKGKKRNICLPFFYNPDLNCKISNAEENKSLNIELNIDANYINSYLNNLEKSKRIYQIWNGNIQTSKFDFPVKFLTTYPNEVFSKLLNLPDNLLLGSKTTTKEVVNYIEKNITKDEKLFLFSWVEIDQEKDLENYRKLADEYDKNDKTALIKNGEDKFYLFPISNRYSRLFRKITPCFEFLNKDLMNKLDKIIAVAIVVKNPLIACSGNTLNTILLEERITNDEILNIPNNELNNANNPYSYYNYDQQQNNYNYDLNNNLNYPNNNAISQAAQGVNQDYYQTNENYPDYTQDSNFIQEESQYYQKLTKENTQKQNTFDNNVVMEVDNEAEQDKMSSITDENEDLNNNTEVKANSTDKDVKQSNEYISEEANLELYLRNDDLTMLEDYVNRHFSNLSQEEMVNKLMSLDENFREKLLNLVMEYQQKISNGEEMQGTVNQIEAGKSINFEENNNSQQQSEILETISNMNQKVSDSNIYESVNEIPQVQNEILNLNNQDLMQNNVDSSNNLVNGNNGFVQNSQSNMHNMMNNLPSVNENNMLNTGVQNQSVPNMPFYPNQNPNYYQQQQNQFYPNMQHNYQNMGYNQNNFNQNPRIMNNMVPHMNYQHAPQNNFLNNNPNYQMNSYQQTRNQMNNPTMNMHQGGYRKGNYNSYGGNYNRNFGGQHANRNNPRNQQNYMYNNPNPNVVNMNYQNPNSNPNMKEDTFNQNNPNNNN